MVRQLDDAGRFWLGNSRKVATEVLDSTDWQPDGLEDWCWRCGGSVGPGEWSRQGCASCKSRSDRRIGNGIIRLGPYAGELGTWIKQTKYQQWHEMGDALGRLLGRQILRAGLVDPTRTVVVPMPMPWQRRIYRGIDHAHVFAGAAAREMGSVLMPILRRSNGPTQSSLEPGQRQANAKQGLSIRRRLGGWPLSELEAEVVLVDDVSTTGASLRAAIQILRELKPAAVIAAVLAVSDEAARRARRNPSSSGRTDSRS